MIERQLAIFFDGDWAGTSSGTTLQRLCALTRSDVVQIYFDTGQQTVLREGVRAGWDPVLARAKSAYEWLGERYRDGTSVYVFGYSAGGIAALRLVRMLAVGGLLRLPDEDSMGSIVRWETAVAEDIAPVDLFAFRKAFSRTLRIRFLGLLDASAPFSRRDELGFLQENQSWMADGRLNPIVEHAFNALSVDESSGLYEPVIWDRRARQTRSLTQAWFRGSHLALGAALAQRGNPLALFPLEQLAFEAARRGLKLRPRWRTQLRREQGSRDQWNVGIGDPWAGDRAPFDVGTDPRSWGAGVEGRVDASTRDLARVLGPPVALAEASPAVARPDQSLTYEEQTLFELNGLKPPDKWGIGAPRAPADDAGLIDEQPPDDERIHFESRVPVPVEQGPRALLVQFLQGAMWSPKIARTLEPGLLTWLQIRIDASDPEWLQPSPLDWFPEPDFLRNRGSTELTVVLSAPSVFPEPQLKHISLPRRGSSSLALFGLGEMIRGSVFEARVTVLHRNRVLQSAVVNAPIGTSVEISMVLDANLVQDFSSLRRRAPTDLCILINERPCAGSRALIVAGEMAREIAVASDDPIMSEIINDLGEVAGDLTANALGASHPKKVFRLRNLAVLGRSVYDALAEAIPSGSPPLAAPWPLDIQVVAAHKAKLYPLEFAYDYPAPGALLTDVKMCPYWKRGAPLEQGTPAGCFDKCKLLAHGKHVCPNGFWGVKKKIERHGFQSGTVDQIPTQSKGTQRKLCLRGAAVLGVSQVLHTQDQKASKDLLLLIETNLRAKPVSPVKHWDHLKELVAAHGPPLIVLLPHVQKDGGGSELGRAPGGVYLEIESVLQRSSEITSEHVVRADLAPLVLLLGCASATSYSKYDQSILHFFRAGAAAVVAPVSHVAPSNVVRFVRDFSQALAAILRKKSPSLSEAMRDARRTQFMDGNLPALGITAFGDLDLRITLKG